MNLQDGEERETAIVALGAALLFAAAISGKSITVDTALDRSTEFIDEAQRRFPTRKQKPPLR